MKCPKCGYLGFETTNRCRNCGYDFSLSVIVESSSELPLRGSAEPEGALADFDLSGLDMHAAAEPSASLDLDRLIGVSDTPPAPVGRMRAAAETRAETSAAVATPPPEDVEEFVSAPRPALPPLGVRRTAPEIVRRRTPRTLRRDDAELPFQLDSPGAVPALTQEEDTGTVPAPRIARLAAALVDLLLLGGIDVGVLYLTLAIAGLSLSDVRVLPPIPMGAFLLLLNGGYLITFTAAGGQTIGKMLARIRVIGDDGGRVDVPAAILRAAGVAVSVLTLGLLYLPALMTSDGRALHDRPAGTRVVKIA